MTAVTTPTCPCNPLTTDPAITLLQERATATWERLELSHQLGIATGEQTLTDNNLIELIRHNLPNLRIYKAVGRDEPEKGFDWEWWVGNQTTGYWRYSIQAKKLNLGTRQYQCVRHHVAQRWQIDILADHARTCGAIPLYCFYNAVPNGRQQRHWHCARPFVPTQLGCSLAPLAIVRATHNRRIQRTFDLFHQDPRVLPWHCIPSPAPTTNGATPPNPFAPTDHRPRLFRTLPAFLQDHPTPHTMIDLPDDLYQSELGGHPRWIMILDTGERA